MTEKRSDGQGGGQRQWREKIRAKPLLTQQLHKWLNS